MDIYGTAGDDTMEYLAGPGQHVWVNLWGGAGNDTIRVAQVTAIGEAGNDTIIGVKYDGAGLAPSAAYWNSPSGITADLGTGVVQDGWGSTDTLVNIHWLQDSRYNDHITGSSADDTVSLSRGSDTFLGGGGTDTVMLDIRSTDAVTTYDIASGLFTIAKQAPYDHGASTLFEVARVVFTIDHAPIGVSGAADTGVTYAGSGGRDIVHSGKGNDTIDGAAGLDVAVYPGNRAAYTIGRSATGLSVGGPMGQDTLSNVERLEFADKGIAFDADGTLGQALRLYNAAFDRMPDAFGLGFWMNRLDSGVPLLAVAEAFAVSPEFQDLYRGATTGDVVAKLYANILDRAGEQDGGAFWSGVLDRHETTLGDVLRGFSESAENVARMVGVMQNGVEYLPYNG